MDGRRMSLGLLIVLVFSLNSFGTNPFYRDVAAVSPNRRYRVDASSPDNAKKELFPWGFQSNFRYVLRDRKEGVDVWEFNGGHDLVPLWVAVDDSGWVVVWDSWHQLHVVSRAGKPQKAGFFFDSITKDESDRYVAKTTAGPMWDWLSHRYFTTLDGRPVFVLRAYWDRRLIADLESAKLLKEDAATAKALDQVERTYVKLAIRRGVVQYGKKPTAEQCDELGTAAFLAGRLSVREVIPTLRAIEAMPAPPYAKAEEPCRQILWLRRIAQLSLRRLGETPAGYPPAVVWVGNDKPRWSAPERAWPRTGRSREELGRRVVVGMSRVDVLKLIGPPDQNVPGDWAWEYDMDGEHPYTLRIAWTNEKTLGNERVRSTQKIDPPVWKEVGSREIDLDLW